MRFERYIKVIYKGEIPMKTSATNGGMLPSLGAYRRLFISNNNFVSS